MRQSIPSARGADDTKVGGVADTPELYPGPEGPQQAREMCCQKPHEAQQGEVQSPTPERSCPSHYQFILGTIWLESSLADKDLEALVEPKLNMTQQCAKKSNAWAALEGVLPAGQAS